MFDINHYPLSAEDRETFHFLFKYFVANPSLARIATNLPCSTYVRSVLSIALYDAGITLATEPNRATQLDQPNQLAQPAQLGQLNHLDQLSQYAQMAEYSQLAQTAQLAQLAQLYQMAQMAHLTQHDPRAAIAAQNQQNQQNLTLPWPNPIIPYQCAPMSAANPNHPGTALSTAQLLGQGSAPIAQGKHSLLHDNC